MTWTQTASGRAVDLLTPKAADIDFIGDVAPGLARIARFAGGVATGPYSVAQHSVLGADAILQETGRVDLAAWFLLHDGHEYVIGDLTSPATDALGKLVDLAIKLKSGAAAIERVPGEIGPFKAAITLLKRRLDGAIHEAAGIPYPGDRDAEHIRTMDLRMLRAERDQLGATPPGPWSWLAEIERTPPVPLRGRITIWSWPAAADEWLRRLKAWCPQANGL